MGILTTLALLISAVTGTGESQFDSTLSFTPGEKYHIGAAAVGAEDNSFKAQNSGWYITPNIGMNLIDNFTETVDGVAAEVSFDSGVNYGISLGKELSNNFSLQFDFAEADNDIDVITVNGLGGRVESLGNALGVDNASISFEQTSLMINGIWEFGETGRFKPYLGLGLGQVKVDVTIDATVNGTAISGNNSDWYTAYGALAGLNVALNSKSYITLSYRYMVVDGDDSDLENHTFGLGLSFLF